MPEQKQDVVVRVSKGITVGHGLLRGITQHLADVAALTKEVVELRRKVAEYSMISARSYKRAEAYQVQLDAVVGRTDRLGFGKRMA